MDEMKILISLKNSSKRNSRVEKNSPMRNCGGGQFRDSLPRGNESTWPCRAWRVHSIFYRVMSRRNIDRVDTNVPPLSLLFFQHGNMAVTSSSYRNYALFTRYSTLWKFPLSSSFSSERKIDFSNGEDQCRFRTKSLKDNGIPLIRSRIEGLFAISGFLTRERIMYIELFGEWFRVKVNKLLSNSINSIT